MQNSAETIRHKIVIINRAVSGSGKTSMTRYVIEDLRARGLSVAVCSTDDFFMLDGRYVFDVEKLNGYHAENLANFTAELERGTDVVICDNMNLLPWQSQPYTDAARKYNYRILFLNFLPRELEKHLASQIVTPEKPDAHGLSKEALELFIQNFHDYNDLLDRNTVRDIKRHHVFTWNYVDNVAMDTGELAQYFDSDVVITIRHEEFDDYKTTLADSIMQLMLATDEELNRRGVKKHYLLTWYGITDLRASLGFEPTDGPVLGALRTGRFTDVIILGYTNPNKSEDVFSDALRREWENLRNQPLETRLAYPRNKVQVIIDAVSNTENGHSIFRDFIKAAQLPVRIQFLPQELSHLNDARAIDEAARKALRLALSDEDEKDVTCFLSPGTPVMAYTWGMVSRTNPQLNLRVIASSDPRKPPESINLPKDLTSPFLDVKNDNRPAEFDVLIHLLGTGTNLPQYFSAVQFPARTHWFITSTDSNRLAGLQRLLPPDSTMGIKYIDAFNPKESLQAFESIIRQLPSSTRIGADLTGGTKLMFAGALNACNEFLNVEPFYYDIKENNITFIRTGSSIPFKGVRTIDGFFTANGFDISNPGYWEDKPVREERKEITLKLWENRSVFERLYNNKAFKNLKKTDSKFHISSKGIIASLKGGKPKIILNGESLSVPDCTDFPSYLCGGWLEEYAYLYYLPKLMDGTIFDLRTGMSVVRSGDVLKPGEMPTGEFDCVFTDGYRLFIVECKARPITQEHFQKLENNLKTYGGIAAKGIFFSTYPLSEALQARISSSTSIQYFELK